jgi:hypothetical protein
MEQVVAVVILAAFTIAVFLLCRELFCWYWKINRRLEIQEEQLKLQQKQTELLQSLLTEQTTCKSYLEAIKQQNQPE